jgi:hypothetical protein
MRYLGLATMEQDALLADLEAMPDYLTTAFAALSPADAVAAGADGTLAPVEQCWHLADLEREGYGLRIERLRAEVDPVRPSGRRGPGTWPACGPSGRRSGRAAAARRGSVRSRSAMFP